MKTIRTALLVTIASASALLGPALHAQQAQSTPQQTEASVAPAEAAVPAPALPALWKVSDEDTTIYLFGTIHLLPKGVNWYHGEVASAFEESQELVTELAEVPQDQTVSVAMRIGSLPQGQTLRGQMGDAERAKFEAALKSLKIPEAAFDRLKPWFATVALATIPLRQAGYSPDSGAEAELERRNKALGRPHLGLETLEFQLGIFDGLSAAAQKTYLLETIDTLPTIPQEIDKMVASWSKGDAAALAGLLNEVMKDPALNKALLTDRNKNWSAWIDDRMDRPGTVFVAVGAGHLGGKDSVQDFLDKAGLKVVRVQ